MLCNVNYNRSRAVDYAARWAFSRNPNFFDFENIGGDCTNFVSQCLFAGCQVMNYNKTYGWYYISPSNRAPAWSAAKYLYNFLTANQSVGPYAVPVTIDDILPGDLIFLADSLGTFYHSVIVVAVENSGVFVAAHSVDSFMRPLDSYSFDSVAFLHVLGARTP